jgi:hypothetical protein
MIGCSNGRPARRLITVSGAKPGLDNPFIDLKDGTEQERNKEACITERYRQKLDEMGSTFISAKNVLQHVTEPSKPGTRCSNSTMAAWDA